MNMTDLPHRRTRHYWWHEHRLIVLRAAVITAVLLMSVGVAIKFPERFMPFVLLAPLGIAGVLILMKWPPLGLLIVIVAGVLLKVYVPGFGLVAILLAALTALWLFDMTVRQRAISLIKSSTLTPLLLFTAAAILAFGAGQFPWYPIAPAPMDAQLGGLGIFVLSFCAFLLAAHQIRNMRWLKVITAVFLVLGGVAAIVSFFPGIRNTVLAFYHRSILGGSLFWTWLVAMTVSQALYNRKLDRRWRLLLGLVLAGLIFARVIQGRSWSSGWIPSIFVIFAIIWVGSPRIALPLTVVGGLLILPFYNTLYTNYILVGDNEYSTLTRLEAWRIVFEIVKVNPILGLGPANYRFYTPLFPILGWYVQFNSHNNYVDIIAQTGLLGLIFFLWFFWEVGKVGFRLIKKVPAGGFERAYVYGCIGGLAGTIAAAMLGDWVLPFVYNIGIEGMRASSLAWLFLGGLIAMEQIVFTAAGSSETAQEK